ncbi:MAG: hypothetical protein A3H02_01095 [Candidatus Niyogibacteria bacterium RIFCSPLOWO2_12_FULL_41_13]|uniref:Ribonuclease J n=1 Tax=Candidatus Niyogibacteria bacterium RIFCSPLOWO2_12_FULL_41_13 TaxID=1801726 RepID=A0A1G2F4I0_9BACT|nr:MAG: hypothetical protein A3H02_01095 [Candidatus Niyogibacteria bacterium RIFCSPLOWO2_12_FULL_41_13]
MHKEDEAVRFIALGGLEEIGRNMMIFEYKNEIIAIDAGFQFPEETTPGIDFIIPNISYLEGKKQNVRALVITHGHYDHIGAIPYIMEKIGNPPVYATSITKEIIARRQEEFPHSAKLNFEIIKPGETRKLSENFTAHFFPVTHNIPEGVGLVLETPAGKIVHPGEFKFDYDLEGKPKDLDIWEKIGKQGINALLLDSTGAEEEGWSLSERVVEKELERIFKAAKGRIVVGTFASLLDRLNEIIKIAERLGKNVAVSGRSMKDNIQIARKLGFMKFEKETFIPLEEIGKYPDDKILIICTGAQGEPEASLARIASGEHRHIQIKKGDTVILSASVIPGNERAVQSLRDEIARQGAIIYHYKMMDIHSSGHAPIEELKTVMRFVKPKFFIPIHGYYFMRWRNAQHAQEALGLKPEQTIVSDNGRVVLLKKDSALLVEERVPANYVMVDGLGVGDVREVVLRDRQVLSADGIFVIIAVVDGATGKVRMSPDIISRGFVYLRESKELLFETRKLIRRVVEETTSKMHPVNWSWVKDVLRERISSFLFRKTQRRPMVLPVIIEV